ncbi:MAG: glycosyltransferase family 2 protein [Lachnospiraceae bacterium]|nr:glycosyltransferase family 2 protein [Lachnospiraceae bacterium]
MKVQKGLISFVIPCYCSEKTIGTVVDELIGRIKEQSEFDYEIILVNDCSKDRTSGVIKELAKINHNIVAVDFSRNFGQHSALMAGFQKVLGEYVVCLDDDGQMPIESVFDLISELEKGADVAFGQYEEIKQNWARNMGSKVNVWMTELLLEKPKNVFMSSFWAGKRFVIEEILRYDAAYPYIGGLLLRVTRNMVSVPVKHRERAEGRSGYTFFKLLNLWMNGFTAFSVKPLRFATFCGGMSAVIGFIYGIVIIIRKLLNPDILLGYASTVTLILFIGGMIMLLLGLLGEYIGRIYICLNKAPQYVVRDVVDYREKEKNWSEEPN